jgi:acetoacetyl-CoA synthetase
VHRAAGILLKLRVEQKYSFDIHEGDKLFFFTTCGWMMWNWLLYILGSGASIVLYDGNPMSPRAERLIDIAEFEKITMLGLSAKYIDSIRKAGISPKNTHHLDSLRTIMSTGSVLAPESFDYVYDEIKSNIHLASMSGGTDICGCFIAGIPTQPVFRGEIQGPCLGTATQVFDEHGKPAQPNVKGELVCTVPFPSMPLGFWGDTDGSKYRAAYFEGFPNVWTHGDFASRSEVGGFTMYGRSDATLNSKGVRIGTAEIYRVVETFPEIAEAMAVAQDWDDDSRVILFVTLTSQSEMTPELETSIKQALKTQASPRHVPDLIIVAPELPRTKSNKLVELAVTDVINGRTVRNKDALANANALDWFASLNLKSK